MPPALRATSDIVNAYLRLFVNRRAYTLQSMRPHPATGRHHYFRAKQRNSDAPLGLTAKTIRQHLEGELTIGLYAINPITQRCKWMVIDADYKRAMEDLLKLQYQLTRDKVEPALEMSKRGGHLWIFLAEPLFARDCRIYIHTLAKSLDVPVKGAGRTEGIEVFPKHDAIAADGFGNAIRGPLGIHRGANHRYWFYGADYTLAAQIAYLDSLRKVTEAELQQFTAGLEPSQVPSPGRFQSVTKRVPEMRGKGFRILDHVGNVRRVGRNYVTRCPSCAKAGHDRSGDNLAILIADPHYYQCWAGCDRAMIRAAIGHPVREQQRN